MPLALLPVANGFDRHFDLFREGRLRKPAARTHMAYELCRVAMVDRLFAAVRKDCDDPSVGFKPYPHHGRYPFDGESANGLPDSRPQFVNERKTLGQAGITAGVGAPLTATEECRSDPTRQRHGEVVDRT